jgi:hypothetical protein
MPQLDKLSFINQLFWFFLFYICFYFLMLKTFLPVIGRTIKLREKLLGTLVSTKFEQSRNLVKIIKNSLDLVSTTQVVVSSVANDITVLNDVKTVVAVDESFVEVKNAFVDESVLVSLQKLLIK